MTTVYYHRGWDELLLSDGRGDLYAEFGGVTVKLRFVDITEWEDLLFLGEL